MSNALTDALTCKDNLWQLNPHPILVKRNCFPSRMLSSLHNLWKAALSCKHQEGRKEGREEKTTQPKLKLAKPKLAARKLRSS
eukprot:1154596-Pelagomonas_calceolata.AAC.1